MPRKPFGTIDPDEVPELRVYFEEQMKADVRVAMTSGKRDGLPVELYYSREHERFFVTHGLKVMGDRKTLEDGVSLYNTVLAEIAAEAPFRL
jgi:hypothetical protein